MNINEKLAKIQQEISVPKSHYNEFGEYYYRNAEDIMNAVKPLLEKHKCVLLLSDEVIEAGGKLYVKACAILKDLEKEGLTSTTALAREQGEKKKMDSSQLTGAASSYARKYALNGLLLLDDVKDADHYDNREPKTEQNKVRMATDEQIASLEEWRLSFENKQDFKAEKFIREELAKNLTYDKAQTIISRCEAKADNGGQN